MDIPQNPVDTAFSPAIRTVQQRKGSGEACDRLAMGRDITEGLAQFIATRTSFYLASASADGQPYIQHRGGPAGFLRVLDATTLAFADFRGNRQYISTGNFSENPKAFIFLMDYPNRRRIKIWGRMRVVEDDPYLLAGLLTDGYRAMPEQAMVLEVAAWDMNCPQHIPPFIPRQDVAAALAERDARIAALEAELAALR